MRKYAQILFLPSRLYQRVTAVHNFFTYPSLVASSVD
jgi:hypothetical protein